ncbi:transposase [Streptomyces sp. YIM B13518]|uniref:transposase n=1 Tax=Streptomyces sp. YIM B13518 TaxID=3366316 RepID=UPI0036CB028D
MTSENVSESEAGEPTKAVSAKAMDDQLIDELVSRAQAEGLQLTGEGGLLQQLTKRLLEDRAERLRHHLRRPSVGDPPVTTTPVTPLV